ncbi:MAG: multiheme c-type cytochrome [Terracidiphilus sp.]
MNVLKDAGHLFRFAGLFVLAFLIFLVVRHFVVPKSFGQYGHYRAAAIGEIGARGVKFAGHETCESCHVDVADTKAKGKHAHVNCEACHGAQAQHASADDPSTAKPPLPDPAVLCVRCHTASAAKPKTFPQIVPGDHMNGGACKECHKAHSPGMDAEPAPGGAK